jgi:hypothetical protein
MTTILASAVNAFVEVHLGHASDQPHYRLIYVVYSYRQPGVPEPTRHEHTIYMSDNFPAARNEFRKAILPLESYR